MIETDRLTDEFLEKFGKDNEYLLADLDKQIAKLYAKYAKDNGLTYLDALKYLTDNEREEFQKDLKFYMEKVWDRAYLKENRAYLQALSVRARVKRLEVLKAEIIKSANKLYGGLSEQIPQHTADIVNMAGKTVTETLKVPEIDKAETWGKLAVDDRYIKTILEMPFEGENYSERIWGNCADFERVLNRTVTNGLVTGKSYNEIAKEMSKKLDVEINKCKRLIATEDTFIANQTSVRTYEENGVKYYKFVARIDQRTSPQCREKNGKVFEVAKAQAGENLPPLHPWCRSVIVPVFEKEEDKNKPSDTNEITVKTADENKRNFEPIRGINGKAPKLDKKSEKWYNVSDSNKPVNKTTGARKFVFKYDPLLSKKENDENKKAVEAYNNFKRDNKDIAKIVKSTGLKEKHIKLIKSHIFFKRKKIYGVMRLLDPSIDMAESWQRLIDGNFNKNDITLLKHEYMELRLMEKGMNFHDAHGRAVKDYFYKTRYD